jgi:membrane AbrB-like protein
MTAPDHRFKDARRVVETLLIATVGGMLAGAAGIPAGRLSGAMLFVAVAAVCGRPMFVPQGLARVTFVVMGASLGAVVMPQTLHGIGAWPVSMAVLAVAMLCIMAATASYLRFVHGWDMLSALFASSPGALSQVVVLSIEAGADLRGVVMVQSIRVFILTLGLPAGMALFGLSGVPVFITGTPSAHPLLELAALLAASTLVALLFHRLRFPGGLIFGAMLPSGLLHGTGLVHVALPVWAISVLMIALGAISGSRFADTDGRMLLRLLGAALGSFAVAMTVTLACALTASWMLSLRIADVVVAYSPGALDAMMLLALALTLDPVFVGAHHVGRFVLVSACLPLFVRLFGPASVEPAVRDAPQPAIQALEE